MEWEERTGEEALSAKGRDTRFLETTENVNAEDVDVSGGELVFLIIRDKFFWVGEHIHNKGPKEEET